MPTPVTRVTAIFQATTVPANTALASPHTAGWSESWWTQMTGSALLTAYNLLFLARARLLPATASIIGWRISNFSMDGNRLLPGTSQSGERVYAGQGALDVDLPQAAIQLKGSGAATGRNSFFLRGIPDEYITGGEWNPTPAGRTNLNSFMNILQNGSWGFVGRDLTQPRVRVQQLFSNGVLPPAPATSTVTLQTVLAGVVSGSFLRFSRVYGSNGQAIRGAFAVSAPPTGSSYPIYGEPGLVLAPSGTARLDVLVYTAFAIVNFSRAAVRKVGRPLQGYRGRRSA